MCCGAVLRTSQGMKRKDSEAAPEDTVGMTRLEFNDVRRSHRKRVLSCYNVLSALALTHSCGLHLHAYPTPHAEVFGSQAGQVTDVWTQRHPTDGGKAGTA